MPSHLDIQMFLSYWQDQIDMNTQQLYNLLYNKQLYNKSCQYIVPSFISHFYWLLEHKLPLHAHIKQVAVRSTTILKRPVMTPNSIEHLKVSSIPKYMFHQCPQIRNEKQNSHSPHFYMYSTTCLERPPHRPQKCGLSQQVVSGDRFSYIWNIGLYAKNVWSVKTGGLSWQWSLKIGSTVFTLPLAKCEAKFGDKVDCWFQTLSSKCTCIDVVFGLSHVN